MISPPPKKKSIVGFPATSEEFKAIKARAQAVGASSVIARLASDSEIELEFHIPGQSFDRIRRITGYLVGTLSRFNDANKAEESDRVKHSIFSSV